jgi:hypothetical protein
MPSSRFQPDVPEPIALRGSPAAQRPCLTGLTGRPTLRRMRWLRPAKVERTCQECGETWEFQAAYARDRYSGIRRRGYAATPVVAVHDARVLNLTLEQQMAEVHRRDAEAAGDLDARKRLGICPKCGSERYAERRFRR